MSKFSGISFPFYGLRKEPRYFQYEPKRIIVYTDSGVELILDDRNYSGSTYFERLLQLELNGEPRVEFDYTCVNLQTLIHAPVKWGIDNSAKIHRLDRKERFKVKCAKIDDIRDDLLWVKGISYPFSIKYDLINSVNDYIFVILLNIDNTWYLYKFSYDDFHKKEITL